MYSARRPGDYRIFFSRELPDEVVVLEILHRGEAYKIRR
ncbi:MAG: hypothetical protein LBL41_00410 [Bifidobacteriaceae bacterium]|nr:hypothetical protein [Bifidobacteriaceae bacterium]